MAYDITNKELVAALRPMYGQGPSIGLKLLWQEALSRLESYTDQTSTAKPHSEELSSAQTSWQGSGAEDPAPTVLGVTDQSQTAGPVATDQVVANMPTTARQRADVRMGRNRERGKP